MAVVRGKKECAKRVCVYGPEGIGKSTFASMFPDPIFIDTENGTNELDVARFEGITSWDRLIRAIKEVNTGKEPCKTIIIDTMDWAEKMAMRKICDNANVSSIEDFGWGKGYVILSEIERDMYKELDKCIDKGINVVITAHAQMRKFEQPDESGAYDRWELKLEKKTSPLLKEWVDMLLFANYRTIVVEDSKTKTKKAQGGQRVMYTSHHPCWDAKNRVGLPERCSFDYKEIEKFIPTIELKSDVKKEEPEEKKIDEEVPDVKKGGAIHQKMYQLMEKDDIPYVLVQLFLENKGIHDSKKLLADLDEGFIQRNIIDKWANFSKAVKKFEQTAEYELPFA